MRFRFSSRAATLPLGQMVWSQPCRALASPFHCTGCQGIYLQLRYDAARSTRPQWFGCVESFSCTCISFDLVSFSSALRVVLEFEGQRTGFINLDKYASERKIPTAVAMSLDDLRGMAMTAFYARNFVGLAAILVRSKKCSKLKSSSLQSHPIVRVLPFMPLAALHDAPFDVVQVR